jgi:hypothetical protein
LNGRDYEIPTYHRHRWKDNVKMDIREIGFKGVDWLPSLRIGINGGPL